MRSGRAGEARSAIVAFQQMRRDRAGAGAFHAWAQAHPFLPSPGTLRHVDHAHRAGRLGHGRQWLGGGLGPQDDADSIGAIRLAVDRGINWIDTAAVYGLGHSEEIVRRALAQMAPSERPYVFTKCGLTWSDTQPQATPRHRRAGKHPARGRGFVAPSGRGADRPLSNALAGGRRHRWTATGKRCWRSSARARSARWGCRTITWPSCGTRRRWGMWTALQPPFSAIQRSAAADLIPWCEAHGTGVIVYSPMQSGLLSGGFSEARAASLPADDWRSRHAEFRAPALQRNLALAQAFRPVAERHGRRSPPPRWPGPWPGRA